MMSLKFVKVWNVVYGLENFNDIKVGVRSSLPSSRRWRDGALRSSRRPARKGSASGVCLLQLVMHRSERVADILLEEISNRRL